MEPQSTPQSRFQLLESLFNRASGLPPHLSPAQRAAEARAWCGDDDALSSDLLELLASDSSVSDSLASNPPVEAREFLKRAPDPENEDPAAPDPWLNHEIGPFRLEKMLGRGGMGVVYLGQRVTGGFSQTAAVKLVARNMRSKPALEHFFLERDALARLEHRNIARLLDGGVTSEGVPFVAMEYVEGRRLDEVADDPATTLEDVVRLMLQLCEAVTYVHRNLILHRDLKPGNVLVTPDGTVKLLDFGTLKMIGPAAVDSAMTQAGMRPVTVRYASPEHIQGDPVSTATDVYSLGMVLYRLLAGRLPGSLYNLPVGEYLKRLRDDHLRPPSVVRSSTAPGNRDDERSHASRQKASDLDAIALKAIRFEPAERYPSVAAMAADFARVLANQPVLARNGSLSYRATKFYRRHTGPLLASAAILLVLLTGLAAMAHESRLATLERQRAEAGVADEQKLAHSLLFDFFEQLKAIPGSTDAQRRTVSQALQYLDSLTRSQVIAGSSLEMDNVEAYTKMGQVLGSPYEENLGDVSGGIQTLQKAVTLARQLVAREPHNLAYLQALSSADLALGRIYFGSGDPTHALQYIQPAADTSTLIAQDRRADAAMLAQAASVLDGLGDLYGLSGAATLGDPKQAIANYTRSSEMHTKGLALDPACARCRRGIAIELWKIGLQTEDTDPVLAAAEYNRGLATIASFSPEDQRTTRIARLDAVLRDRLGVAQFEIGHTADSIRTLQPIQQRFRDAIAKDPIDNRARFDLAALDPDLADAYEASGNLQAAADTVLEGLTTFTFLVDREPTNALWKYHRAVALLRYATMQANPALKTGSKEKASRLQHEGLVLAVSLAQSPDATPDALSLAANALLDTNPTGASAQQARGFAQRAVDATAPQPTPAQLVTLAEAEHATGDNRHSQQLATRAVGMLADRFRSRDTLADLDKARRLAQP